MRLDVRTNPALLKLDLYCRGTHIDDSVYLAEEGGRPILRTRAGLGSGLELVLPGDHYTNVPVTEAFVKASPYVLKKDGRALWLHRDGEPVSKVELAPKPAWYDRHTTSGKLMSRVGTLQGTYLGIYPLNVCEFWRGEAKQNCHFCSVGLNLGVDDASEKSVQEVVEVARAAVADSGVTYIDFNTGHDEGLTFLDRLEPYLCRVKRETQALVGVQSPPHRDFARYVDLREMGVNRVSFCFEVFDPERFREVCPGKAKTYGLERYLDAIEWTARLGTLPPARPLDRLRRPWIVNGEIIAGLEPVESTLKAIDWITSVGAIPTVCVFRPLKGTDYEDEPPPRTEDLVPIFRRLYEACMERSLPIGVAPNVKVSLVLLPEECRSLVPRRFSYAAKEAKLRAMALFLGSRLSRGREEALARSEGPQA